MRVAPPPFITNCGRVPVHGVRSPSDIRVIVVHVTEDNLSLHQLARVFREMPEGTGVYASTDGSGAAARYTRLSDVTWHVKSHNHECIGFEQQGSNSTTRREWLTRRGDQVRMAAWITAYLSQTLGIPLRKCAADRAWLAPSGVCRHQDIPDNDHDDPGNNYPYGFMLALARIYRHLGGPHLATKRRLVRACKRAAVETRR